MVLWRVHLRVNTLIVESICCLYLQHAECFDTIPPIEAQDGDVDAKSSIVYSIVYGKNNIM